MRLNGYVGILILLTSLTVGVMAEARPAEAAPNLRVPRLKVTGAFNKPVVAQTSPEFVEKKNGATMLRRFYVTRLEGNQFEYGYALYRCAGRLCELYGDAISLDFYESCNGFKSNGKPNCARMISTRVDVVDPLEEAGSKTPRRTWYWGARHENSNSEWNSRSNSP